MYLKKIVMVLDGVVLLGIGISGGLLGVWTLRFRRRRKTSWKADRQLYFSRNTLLHEGRQLFMRWIYFSAWFISLLLRFCRINICFNVLLPWRRLRWILSTGSGLENRD
jgi:hypothetical protein